MFQKFVRLYNQSLERFTRNGCTLYTLFMIIQLQWGVIVNNDYIKKTLKEAEKDKTWGQSWGAYFSIIYKWFVKEVKAYTWQKIWVLALDIRSKEFEEYLKKWHAFWLWLKNWNKKYFHHTSDWKLTKTDLDAIKIMWGWYWHNHTYYNWVIIDSVGTLKDQTIKMNLSTLRYGVKIWIYYPTARTLFTKDKLLEKYLKKRQNKEKVNPTKLNNKERSAFYRAYRLITYKK